MSDNASRGILSLQLEYFGSFVLCKRTFLFIILHISTSYIVKYLRPERIYIYIGMMVYV